MAVAWATNKLRLVERIENMGIRKWTLESILQTVVPGDTFAMWRNKNYSAWGSAHYNGWAEEVRKILSSQTRPIQPIFCSKCNLNRVKCRGKCKSCHDKEYMARKPITHGICELCGPALSKFWLRNKCEKCNSKEKSKRNKDRIRNQKNIRLFARKWSLESILKSIVPGETISSWRKRCHRQYDSAHKNGWMEEVKKILSAAKTPNRYWNKQRTLESAKKYKTRNEWKKGCVSSYNAARRKGWLEEASSVLMPKSNAQWTSEEILESAKKYKKLRDWIKDDIASYCAAKKIGIFSEIVKNMETKYSRSLPEIELCEIIKVSYPSAENKRFKKGKTIREIDIYIQELVKCY